MIPVHTEVFIWVLENNKKKLTSYSCSYFTGTLSLHGTDNTHNFSVYIGVLA